MMQLYSGTTCPFSHRCRFVLYEKGMDFQVIDVDLYNKPEDIAVMNPYNRLPVLVERDLILYESNIINEYIDERFPHPQLMPADPVMRARARLMLFNMEVELFSQIDALEGGKEKQIDKARQHVTDRLVERDLVLYESNIINEYIDERFPHPQLMPADPVMRARARLFLFRFEQELFNHVQTLESGTQKAQEKARLYIRENLIQIAPIFVKQKYMLGEEFSMLDVAIAPLLWRLDYYQVQLNKQSAPLLKYAERLFSRQAFIDSMTASEKAMRR